MRNVRDYIPSVEVNVVEAGIAAAAGAAFAQATDPTKDGVSAATYFTYGLGAIGLLVAFKGFKNAASSIKGALNGGIPVQPDDRHEFRPR
jgi:hypothetical protein